MEYLDMDDDFEYKYRATIISCYDVDTMRASISLGFGITYDNMIIRLARINGPELRGPERPQGLIARDRMRELVLGKQVILQTYKDKKGKYGRYIADIILEDGSIANDIIVAEGHAVYKEY